MLSMIFILEYAFRIKAIKVLIAPSVDIDFNSNKSCACIPFEKPCLIVPYADIDSNSFFSNWLNK